MLNLFSGDVMKEVIDFINSYIENEEDKLAENISNSILKDTLNSIADAIATKKEYEVGDILIRTTSNSVSAYIVCSYSDVAIYTHMLRFYPNGDLERLDFGERQYTLKYTCRKRVSKTNTILYSTDFPLGWSRLSSQHELYPRLIKLHDKYFSSYKY